MASCFLVRNGASLLAVGSASLDTCSPSAWSAAQQPQQQSSRAFGGSVSVSVCGSANSKAVLTRSASLPSPSQRSFSINDGGSSSSPPGSVMTSAMAGATDHPVTTCSWRKGNVSKRTKSFQDLVINELNIGCPTDILTPSSGLHFHNLHFRPKGVNKKDTIRNKKKGGVWRMEMASDPLNNCRDSFGNECALEKRARKELEMSEPYRQTINELRILKGALTEMVSKQRYEEAVQLRDIINSMELRKRVLEISAKPHTDYRVGDIIVHRRYGYRGVIYGHDPECSAPGDWQDAMRIEMLPEGRTQPFYHILVDTRDRPGGMSTYVAQENIVLQRSTTPVIHPWISKFFVGFQDGQYMPGAKLREVYANDW